MLTKIKIAIVIALVLGSNFLTWRYMDNKHKAEQLKFQQELVEKDNAVKEKQAQHQKELDTIEVETNAKLARIQRVDVSADCTDLLGDIDRMRDEIYSSFPDMHFSRTDGLPGASD